MKSSSFPLLFLAISFSALSAQGQSISGSQPDGAYKLEVSTQVVVLDVLVTDKSGRPVYGLTRDDFTVIEDKVPQDIRYFESSADRPATPAVASTAELDKQAPDATVNLIVLDELSGTTADETYTRHALKLYLEAEGETLRSPTMLLAVDLHGVNVLSDYTTSRNTLLETLARHKTPHDARSQDSNWQDAQYNAAMHALEGIAQATSGHRGHKNLLWIGKGSPDLSSALVTSQEKVDQMQEEAISALRAARITLYSLDPASMTPGPDRELYDMHDGNLLGGTGMPATSVLSGTVSFRGIVKFTGGRSFGDGNDLDKLIRQTVHEGESCYTLSYRPSSKRDTQHLLHKIEIKMKNPALHAYTREGYFSGAHPAAAIIDVKGRVSSSALLEIGTATRGLMIYNALPLQITHEADSPDAFVVHMKANALPWKMTGDGKQVSELAVVVLGFDVNGKPISQSSELATVSLPVLEDAAPESRAVNLAVKAPTAPPIARLRFVFRSSDAKLGTGNVFLVDKSKLRDPSIGLRPVR